MPFANVWIHLYDTGNRYNVRLQDWDSWVLQDTVEVDHWIDERPMAVIRDMLKKRIPTREILLQNIDLEQKQPLLEEYNARMRQRAEKPPPTPCPYCGKPLVTNSAKQCPHCFMDWHDPHNIKKLIP